MKELPGYIRFAMAGIAIALVITAMVLAQVLLVPLVWAILLTLMVLPIANWWERILKYRALASIVTVLMLVIVIGGTLGLLGTQATGLAEDAPLIATKFTAFIDDVRHFADESLGMPFDQQLSTLKEQLPATAQSMAGVAASTLQATLTTLTLLLIVPLYMFFLLTYRKLFSDFLIKTASAKNKQNTLDTMASVSQLIQRYLRGVGIEVLIVAILVLILFLALGIKHALFFAVLVALLNIIPYLGVLIGSTISVAYAFFTTDSLVTPILVFVLLWVIQIIDNNLVVPYVVGQQIKLNPLAIILVVILGGLIWGVSGMILFIPILGVVKVLLDKSESMTHYGRVLGDK
jgi:predicted PurR-regulated permease PerM